MLGLPPMKPTLLWCRWNQQLVFNFYEKNPTVISAASKNLARNIDNDKWSDGWLTGWLVGTMSNMFTNNQPSERTQNPKAKEKSQLIT